MPARISIEIEEKVLALNGTCTQDEVAKQLGISLPTIRHICNRHNVRWKWQLRDQFGEKNHAFVDGLGRSTIERTTRRLILAAERSLYICERCNYTDPFKVELPRHHIDRDRSNNTVENLEVLCQRCHRLEHGKDQIRGEDGRFIS